MLSHLQGAKSRHNPDSASHNVRPHQISHPEPLHYTVTPPYSHPSSCLTDTYEQYYVLAAQMSGTSPQPSKPSKISEEAFQVRPHFQYTYHPTNAHIAIGFDWHSFGHSSSSSGRPCIDSLLPSPPFRRRRRLLLLRGYHFDLRDYCPLFGFTLHLCARKRRSWPSRCSCRLCFPAHS